MKCWLKSAKLFWISCWCPVVIWKKKDVNTADVLLLFIQSTNQLSVKVRTEFSCTKVSASWEETIIIFGKRL